MFDRNIEKIAILICYSTMAGIIFVEVIRRFAFNQQAAWSLLVYRVLRLTFEAIQAHIPAMRQAAAELSRAEMSEEATGHTPA